MTFINIYAVIGDSIILKRDKNIFKIPCINSEYHQQDINKYIKTIPEIISYTIKNVSSETIYTSQCNITSWNIIITISQIQEYSSMLVFAKISDLVEQYNQQKITKDISIRVPQLNIIKQLAKGISVNNPTAISTQENKSSQTARGAIKLNFDYPGLIGLHITLAFIDGIPKNNINALKNDIQTIWNNYSGDQWTISPVSKPKNAVIVSVVSHNKSLKSLQTDILNLLEKKYSKYLNTSGMWADKQNNGYILHVSNPALEHVKPFVANFTMSVV